MDVEVRVSIEKTSRKPAGFFYVAIDCRTCLYSRIPAWGNCKVCLLPSGLLHRNRMIQVKIS